MLLADHFRSNSHWPNGPMPIITLSKKPTPLPPARFVSRRVGWGIWSKFSPLQSQEIGVRFRYDSRTVRNLFLLQVGGVEICQICSCCHWIWFYLILWYAGCYPRQSKSIQKPRSSEAAPPLPAQDGSLTTMVTRWPFLQDCLDLYNIKPCKPIRFEGNLIVRHTKNILSMFHGVNEHQTKELQHDLTGLYHAKTLGWNPYSMLDKQTKTHWIPKSSIPFEDKKNMDFLFGGASSHSSHWNSKIQG